MGNRERHPLNAEGDFYVENLCCLDCNASPSEAPDLMAYEDLHCYFKKQPETEEELQRAINAVYVTDVCAVRYAGRNPVILEKLPKNNCDIYD